MKRTIVYTALACAAIAVAYLPPRTRTSELRATFYTPERNLIRMVRSLAEREANALILLDQRDRAMAGLEAVGPHLYFADPDLPVRLDSETRALLDDPDSLPTIADAPRVAIAIFSDTIMAVRSAARIPPRIRANVYYLPPAATDGQTCLTVAAIGAEIIRTIREAEDNQLLSLPWNRSSLLGLCEYYHRFGQPSETVEEWLLAGALTHSGPLQTRCARHDLEACEFLVFPSRYRTAIDRVDFAIWSRGPPGTLPSFDAYTDGTFLDAIIDSLGADPFRRFWQDPRPVEESFAANLGVPMVEWVQSFYERRRGQGQPTGPLPRLQAIVLTIATVAGALTWSAVVRSGMLARTRLGRK